MPKKMTVHPAAAIFPMMAPDELEALAADIKANGLMQPLLIDGDNQLIDGRNRLEACQMAGVEPHFEKVNGADPIALILSSNIARRHMSKNQQAMAVAMIYPTAPTAAERGAKGGRGKKSSSENEQLLVHPGTLSAARAVLAASPEKARAVLEGVASLDTMLAEIKEEHGTLANERIRLRKLRELRPDLADSVVNGDADLDDAERHAKQEAEERKQQRWAASVNIIDGVVALDRERESAVEMAQEFDPDVAAGRGEKITPGRLKRVAEFVTALAREMEKKS